MLAGRVDSVCELTRVPASVEMVNCNRWAPVAMSWLKDDVRAGRGPEFVPSELRGITLNSVKSATAGDETWSLRTDRGEWAHVGALERKGESGRVWEISVTRSEARSDGMMTESAAWNYEVVRVGQTWSLALVEVCDYTVVDSCVLMTQIRQQDFGDVIRSGAPG